eukprot:snap_masked-scaffold_67-processed-gene-0.73-mRNA-1 protein AED:1.00 eAED:1.00 QI:0/-1/0/0/-1/1/1/0/209
MLNYYERSFNWNLGLNYILSIKDNSNSKEYCIVFELNTERINSQEDEKKIEYDWKEVVYNKDTMKRIKNYLFYQSVNIKIKTSLKMELTKPFNKILKVLREKINLSKIKLYHKQKEKEKNFNLKRFENKIKQNSNFYKELFLVVDVQNKTEALDLVRKNKIKIEKVKVENNNIVSKLFFSLSYKTIYITVVDVTLIENDRYIISLLNTL